MITSAILERIQLLINQSRYKDAQSYLEKHLSQYPADTYGKYCYALVLFLDGKNNESRKIVDQLLVEDPENEDIIGLSVDIDISDDRLNPAESKAKILIEMDPESSESHLKLARVKLAQKSYDLALESANKALSFDAENVSALNLKILIEGLLGHETTNATIQDALHLDAENPSSIANHGIQLLREGKVNESLERLQYALSLDPNNYLAQHGMQESLKSKFWPYRMFFKFKEFTARLSQKGSWQFIIGTYILFRIIRTIAAKNPSLEPYLMPVIYIIIFLFLLTWVLDPIMNIYLLFNKFGKVLLGEDEKTMAIYCSYGLIGALFSAIMYFGFGMTYFAMVGIVFGLSIIPLGTFLNPVKEKNLQTTKIYTIAAICIGLIGSFFQITPLFTVFLISIFIYQWVINGILIKENSRSYE